MKPIDIAILKGVNGVAEDADLASLSKTLAADGHRVSTYGIRTALYRLESRGLIVQSLHRRYGITTVGELLLNGGSVQEVNAPFPMRYSRNIILFAAVLMIRHCWVLGFDSAILRSVVTNTARVLVWWWEKQRYLK